MLSLPCSPQEAFSFRLSIHAMSAMNDSSLSRHEPPRGQNAPQRVLVGMGRRAFGYGSHDEFRAWSYETFRGTVFFSDNKK
jgi:hypothetical protein